jgi:ribosome-associated translation inhibitor RaiA
MKLLVTAPNITKPTHETLEEHATKKVKKLRRIVREYENEDFEVRISVHKVNYLFEVILEIFQPSHLVAKTKDKDLRKGVDDVVDILVKEIKKNHDKSVSKFIKHKKDS